MNPFSKRFVVDKLLFIQPHLPAFPLLQTKQVPTIPLVHYSLNKFTKPWK